jgi:hypothetical protein
MEEITFVVFVVIIMNILGGCTAPDKSYRLLEQRGYTNIEITGYKFFACGQDDLTHTGFKAKNMAGNTIEGTLCCGILKSCTIRFE